MATPQWKTGDNHPPISGVVKDAAGAPVNISTAVSVRFVSRLKTAPNTVITGAAINDDIGDVPTRGKWHYVWSAALVDAGEYETEIEITWPSSKIETYPSDKEENPTYVVDADLD